MDFSTVYWNSRLQEEHANLIKFLLADQELSKNYSVIDACAGIGPFVVPLGKALKKVSKYPALKNVYANDLNPESMKWLQINLELNKVTSYVKLPEKSKDGVDFVREILTTGQLSTQDVFVLMNLPRFSISILVKKLSKLLVEDPDLSEKFDNLYVIAHHMMEETDDPVESLRKNLPTNFELLETRNIRQLVGEKYSRVLLKFKKNNPAKKPKLE